MKCDLYKGDCLKAINEFKEYKDKILIIDPPFNIGYHYSTYKDNKKDKEYLDWICSIVAKFDKFVLIHYPEKIFDIAINMGKSPIKTVSWVYNSNTAKQHRMIAFFGFKPDFSQVRQPYKNPNDKRILERIKKGATGAKLYDWWNINQVKNVSKEKTEHPCQMPLEVMQNIIGVTPQNFTIVDCFMGSGTTGVACKNLNRRFIGVEMDDKYFQIAKERMVFQEIVK